LFLSSQSNRIAIFCTRHCFPIGNQYLLLPVPVPVPVAKEVLYFLAVAKRTSRNPPFTAIHFKTSEHFKSPKIYDLLSIFYV